MWQAKYQSYETFLLTKRRILFPCVWNFVPHWQNWSLWQNMWFGWLSAVSQLARRVGEGGGRKGMGANVSQCETLPGSARAEREIAFPLSLDFLTLKIKFMAWDLAEWMWMKSSWVVKASDSQNAKFSTVLGSIIAYSDTVESEGRQMKQC